MVRRDTRDIIVDKNEKSKNKYVPKFLKDGAEESGSVCVCVCVRTDSITDRNRKLQWMLGTTTEWMSDKGLLLWLPVKQELIMKSFQGINCFYKEQERLMWSFAGFLSVAHVPHCDTSILKVAKLIFLQVTHLFNGCCFSWEVGHFKWIWLDELKRSVMCTVNIHFVSALSLNKQSSLTPHRRQACDIHHQLLGSALPVIRPPGLCCWLHYSGSTFQSLFKATVTPQLSSFIQSSL